MTWTEVLAFGVGGFGIGVGFVVGVVIVRAARRYLDDEGDNRHDR